MHRRPRTTLCTAYCLQQLGGGIDLVPLRSIAAFHLPAKTPVLVSSNGDDHDEEEDRCTFTLATTARALDARLQLSATRAGTATQEVATKFTLDALDAT